MKYEFIDAFNPRGVDSMTKISQFRFNAIKEQVLSDWENIFYTERWNDLPSFTYFEKRNNEKYIKRVVDELIHLLKTLDFHSNLEELTPHFNDFFATIIAQCPFLTPDEVKYLTSKEQLEATKAFLDQALKEDANLSVESLGQAIRNFWITTLLQTAYGKKVTFTQPLYGYSMLYPYTDNIMDSQNDEMGSKANFCKKLTLHLLNLGDSKDFSQNKDPYERVWAQVRKIYDTYPPEQYRNVQNSLLAIHEAQIDSLKQQKSSMLPYEIDLLGKSFYKGGTSVLADAFLVNPELPQSAQVFAYTYGAILQLCDDLQDMATDKEAQHYTLFSQLKDHYVLDPMLNKINGFIDHSMTLLESLKLPTEYNIQLIISKNTRLLLAYAVIQHEFAFSKGYVRKVSSYLPIGPKALKKAMKRIKKAINQSVELSNKLADKTRQGTDLSSMTLSELIEKDLTNAS